jgi:geranylgeranyl diphosphate synthase, type II
VAQSPTDTAAELLADTIRELSERAPAVVAAAARQLGAITLGLHFGDGSRGTLRAQHSRLLVETDRPSAAEVELHFDERSMNLVFDMQRRPVDELLPNSLDVRGDRDQVLAVWRTFRLLSQRGSGLRAVQSLWRGYRERRPDLWGTLPLLVPRAGSDGGHGKGLSAPRGTGWTASDYLDKRHPHDGATVVEPRRLLWDGRRSHPWWEFGADPDADLKETLQRCRVRVAEEIQRLVPDRQPRAELYDLMRDYPSRASKGLRPTLVIAACCALGGRAQDAVRSAAALELFHNGFLVHDDIADESTHRRNRPTLSTQHGIGLAVNAGDGLNLLAVDTVLSNLAMLGLARTLALIHEVLHMCRETIEGQAIELGWIRAGEVPLDDEDYFHMSTKKTGWYTCVSPCRIGAVCAGETDPVELDRFNEAFRLIGIAFQIQDDVLNLVGEEALYGKEPLGDLLEGKRTVMLIHLLRNADARDRQRLIRLLQRPRLRKHQADAEEILDAMRRYGSLDYAIGLADRLAHLGAERFETDLAPVPESEAKGVLRQIANYVTTRPL